MADPRCRASGPTGTLRKGERPGIRAVAAGPRAPVRGDRFWRSVEDRAGRAGHRRTVGRTSGRRAGLRLPHRFQLQSRSSNRLRRRLPWSWNRHRRHHLPRWSSPSRSRPRPTSRWKRRSRTRPRSSSRRRSSRQRLNRPSSSRRRRWNHRRSPSRRRRWSRRRSRRNLNQRKRWRSRSHRRWMSRNGGAAAAGRAFAAHRRRGWSDRGPRRGRFTTGRQRRRRHLRCVPRPGGGLRSSPHCLQRSRWSSTETVRRRVRGSVAADRGAGRGTEIAQGQRTGRL
jgi:hypothetical protein